MAQDTGGNILIGLVTYRTLQLGLGVTSAIEQQLHLFELLAGQIPWLVDHNSQRRRLVELLADKVVKAIEIILRFGVAAICWASASPNWRNFISEVLGSKLKALSAAMARSNNMGPCSDRKSKFDLDSTLAISNNTPEQ
jgi:hypothetical protein